MKKGETASTKLMCCGESTGTPISDCHSAGEASAARPPLSACTAEPANALLTHTHALIGAMLSLHDARCVA